MKGKEQAVTFLGKDTEFEGKLRFEGTIRMDGRFKGEIWADGNLIVGEDGMVEADMHVTYIVIRGEVHGNIMADQRVDIRAPGKVFGNIQAPAIVMDEGVIFEGTTRMYQAKDTAEGQADVVGSDEYSGEPPPSLIAIYGVVTDQSTGDPIRNAVVRCKGAERKEAKSNASGYYELIHLKDGQWKVWVKAKGYKKGVTTVEIVGGGTHEQKFTLAGR